jgi:hypothetical protein
MVSQVLQNLEPVTAMVKGYESKVQVTLCRHPHTLLPSKLSLIILLYLQQTMAPQNQIKLILAECMCTRSWFLTAAPPSIKAARILAQSATWMLHWACSRLTDLQGNSITGMNPHSA